MNEAEHYAATLHINALRRLRRASAVNSLLGLLYLAAGVLTASVSHHMTASYWAVAWIWLWPVAWAKWVILSEVSVSTLRDWFSPFLM